ncbi:hypothetical protein Lser_V15G42975 [Lactuca serriola]
MDSAPDLITEQDGTFMIGGDAAMQRMIAPDFIRRNQNVVLGAVDGHENPMADEFFKICYQLSNLLERICEYQKKQSGDTEDITMDYKYDGPSALLVELRYLHGRFCSLLSSSTVFVAKIEKLQKEAKRDKTGANRSWNFMIPGFVTAVGSLYFLGHRWLSGLGIFIGGVTHFGKKWSSSKFHKEATLFDKSKDFTTSVITYATLINSKVKLVESSIQELDAALCSVGSDGDYLKNESARNNLRRLLQETLSHTDACANIVQLGKTEVMNKWESM